MTTNPQVAQQGVQNAHAKKNVYLQSFIQGAYQVNRTVDGNGEVLSIERILLTSLEDNHA